MRYRDVLLGVAGGFWAGYAGYRAFEALQRSPLERRAADAASYGQVRRALTVAGIVRGLAASGIFAFGDLALDIEGAIERFPVWLRPAAFAAAVSTIETLVDLPSDFIEGYGLEHRYGLSEQPVSSWATDRLKEHAIGSGVGAVLATLLAAALRQWPKRWPLIAGACTPPLLVLANVAVPLYVMPLFNKYEPLKGPLEDRLRRLAARYGVGHADILRVNMSKQTKKANAFVIGIGTTHRIVVGDTLSDRFPAEETEFVVAHELGHYVAKDTWRMIAAAQISVMLVLAATFFAARSNGEDLERASAIGRLQLWATIFSTVLRPALCAFARSREWAADRFALQATGAAAQGASAFRRLRDQNLAEDEQPRWYEICFSTHPSLRARIEALEQPA